MKFSWKMILLTTILLTASLSISGYFVVSSSFESQLQARIDTAQEDMQLFSTMLNAVTVASEEIEPKNDLKRLLQELTAPGAPLYGNEFSVWDENRQLLFSNQKGTAANLLAPQGKYTAQSFVTTDRRIVTSLKMPICAYDCYVQRQSDTSELYEQTNESLRRCQYIMLIVWTVCIAVTTVFTMLLTRPLRKIARTARQLSNGYYHKRADVRTHDELGQLAGDFNTMAETLEQKIAELADALRRQREFTASFAHELKTPLTSVIGYADTIRSRELTPIQRFQAADYIVSEGKRLEAMSFALLDLFALEKQKPEVKEGSAKKLAMQVEESCQFLLAQKNIELSVAVDDARLRFVPELMHTLLYNLIDNARKASSEGSTIFFDGRMTKDGYLFSVTDEGRGMPKEALERLTEPFYMVDKSRSRAEGGAGLGLALCERIAALHETKLLFSSELEKGTRVSICLGGVVA